ncbi:hypothetical protein H0H93_011152 [Arthromyces matolae]|nr:hypothetical protein H0H93_011152 [Arthromyces matolae]
MMYRSGYSYKDKGQAHILALKMKHEHFHHLLSLASVTTHGILSEEEKARSVRVQWDPERSPSLDVLPYRSIQIGISNQISEKWVNEWILSIEDVTSTARALKQSLGEGITELEELEEKGLHPKERIYEIPENLREILKMNARD